MVALGPRPGEQARPAGDRRRGDDGARDPGRGGCLEDGLRAVGVDLVDLGGPCGTEGVDRGAVDDGVAPLHGGAEGGGSVRAAVAAGTVWTADPHLRPRWSGSGRAIASTSCPAARAAATTWPPTMPVAPVTATFIAHP